MHCKLLRTFVACALGLGWPAAAGAFAIDGSLADWGVVLGDGTSANRTPSVFNPAPVPGVQAWHIEDTDDTAGNGGLVEPLYGGQNYDAEFMAVAVEGNTLYLAIATGVRPDNGFSKYAPGDIRIEARSGGGGLLGRYGIEVGGGAGNSSAKAQRVDTAASLNTEGSTYTLNGSGYTAAASTNTAVADGHVQSAGTIWGDVDWLPSTLHGYPLPAPNAGKTLDTLGFFYANTQFAIGAASDYRGQASYVYTRDYRDAPGDSTAQHAVIELAIADWRTVFGGAEALDIYWGPACGNDILRTSVPEPGALALAAAGLAGLGWSRRRRPALRRS